MSHIIYHIPGKKVGCTQNLEQRKNWGYSPGTSFEIIEILEDFDDQLAGDREWDWADFYGYPRGNHYINRMNSERQKTRYGKTGAREAVSASNVLRWLVPGRKEAQRIIKSKPCTIDGGITVFPSLKALIAVHGQGKVGRYHPNFQYLDKE